MFSKSVGHLKNKWRGKKRRGRGLLGLVCCLLSSACMAQALEPIDRGSRKRETSARSPRSRPQGRVNGSREKTLNRAEGQRPTTSFQILGGYDDRWDLATDVVIIYFEDHTTDIEGQIESWVVQGYEPWVMFNSSQDYTGAYVTGKYDGLPHRDEIQRAADGSDFGVFDEGAYLVPNPHWQRYQKAFVKRSIRAGAKAIVAEEPEFFSTAGYSFAFKAAWTTEYGTPWVDPATNAESRWRARRLMALLYQNHLRDLFKYADTCDPQVKCLVAAHSPFDYAINPMVFPHAGVAELPEVDGYIAQVWSDTARSEMTDPTRDGEDVEAVFQKAFLEYNYFQNLLRGTKKELIVLQDPKSDSEGFPWRTYRRWYEQTVVASSLLNVASFEVMPWPDRFFVQEASQEQQTSFLAVVQGMQDLRNYPSHLSTPYAMLVSDAMLWENADLEEVITGHMGIGVTMLRDGVPIDVLPLERVGEASFLEPYRVIFNWLPLSRTERAALAKWVQKGGNLVCLPSTRPEDEFLKEMGVELQGTRMHSARTTLVGKPHPLVERLGELVSLPSGGPVFAYHVRSAKVIYGTQKTGAAVVFEQRVGRGRVLYCGISPESLARSRFGANVIRSVAEYLSRRDGGVWQARDRISQQRGPYTVAYATQDNVLLEGPAIDLFDAELPLIEMKRLDTGEYAFLYRVDPLPKQPTLLYSGSRIANIERGSQQLKFHATGPFQTLGVSAIYLPQGVPMFASARDAVTANDQLVTWEWNPERSVLMVKYRHAAKRHEVEIVIQWESK